MPAGHFALLPGVNVPCLFYVNFNDEIFVYYNLEMPSVAVENFVDFMDPHLQGIFPPEILKGSIMCFFLLAEISHPIFNKHNCIMFIR
jgi:hypothetical protein